MPKKIAYVSVELDDNVPEYMDGVIRCGSVISKDKYDNDLKDHQDLINNKEFSSENDLIKDIAKELGVSESIVFIE